MMPSGLEVHGGGAGIAVIEVMHDGLFQFMDASEFATVNPFLSDVAEKALDQVEPGTWGGRDVPIKARMLTAPGGHLGMPVGRNIADDGMVLDGLSIAGADPRSIVACKNGSAATSSAESPVNRCGLENIRHG